MAHGGQEDEEALSADIIELARQYGRYGYRKITALLRDAGWLVNEKRVERIWRREGLKVPAKQPKRGRLWLNDGSCIRLQPEHRDHVWSYDFVEDRTHDGRKFRTLNVVDEFTRECLAIRVARKLNSTDVIDVLSDCAVCRATFVLTTALSSSPRPCKTGSRPSEQRPPTLPREARGRTAMSSRSTPASAMNCLTVRSSTHFERRRSSSRVGDVTTILCARMAQSAIDRQPRRSSCPPSLHGRLRNPDQLRGPCSR